MAFFATLAIISAVISAAATVATISYQLIAGQPSLKPGLRTSTHRIARRAYRWILGTARVRGLRIFSRDVDPARK